MTSTMNKIEALELKIKTLKKQCFWDLTHFCYSNVVIDEMQEIVKLEEELTKLKKASVK